MRLFTLFAGSQRILTINADDVQEAREALTTLLGSTDGMVVRAASVNECLAWNSSAMTATREQRTEAPPASTPAGLREVARMHTTRGRTSRRVNRAIEAQFPVR
jgi:hypothetical protein